MKTSYRKQAGFSVVEALLILVVLAALVFVGYTFMNKQKSTQEASSSGSSTSQQDSAESADDVLKGAVNVDNGETANTDAGGSDETN